MPKMTIKNASGPLPTFTEQSNITVKIGYPSGGIEGPRGPQGEPGSILMLKAEDLISKTPNNKIQLGADGLLLTEPPANLDFLAYYILAKG